MRHQKSIRNIVALILSVLVLIGSVGVNLDFHICQGKVKAFSLFGEAEQCISMEDNIPCKSSSSSPEVSKQKCCSNVSIYEKVSVQSDIQIHTNFEDLVPIGQPFPRLERICSTPAKLIVSYSGPPEERMQKVTLNILHQSFLI